MRLPLDPEATQHSRQLLVSTAVCYQQERSRSHSTLQSLGYYLESSYLPLSHRWPIRIGSGHQPVILSCTGFCHVSPNPWLVAQSETDRPLDACYGGSGIVRHLRRASSFLCLGAAFPLSAAAEPVANGGNASCVAVEHRSDRKRQGPRPRQAVKPHGHRKRGCH